LDICQIRCTLLQKARTKLAGGTLPRATSQSTFTTSSASTSQCPADISTDQTGPSSSFPKILQLTHSQWIYRNISLQDKKQGYLRHQQSRDCLQEITNLSELSPDEVPEGSNFLLEINFTELTLSHLETQCYWTLAVNAALTAKQLQYKRGTRSKRMCQKLNRKLPSQKKLGIVTIEQQIRTDGMHQAPNSNHSDHNQQLQTTLSSLIIKRPCPSSAFLSLKSNKRLRKPN
jgi:hypothetical protein